MNELEVKEGLQYQSADESVIRKVDVSAWGSSPTSPTVKCFIDDTNEDVTSAKLTGSASVSGNEITLPALASLVVNTTYRVEVKFTIGSSQLECFMRVKCTY